MGSIATSEDDRLQVAFYQSSSQGSSTRRTAVTWEVNGNLGLWFRGNISTMVDDCQFFLQDFNMPPCCDLPWQWRRLGLVVLVSSRRQQIC
jgi:hypothetical protein